MSKEDVYRLIPDKDVKPGVWKDVGNRISLETYGDTVITSPAEFNEVYDKVEKKINKIKGKVFPDEFI